MEANITLLLKEYGLDDNEIKVYLQLVGNKELTAYKVAKETRIHRSTCYDVLERLVSKGFVTKLEKGGTQHYSANEMSRLISNLKDKESILLSLIPDLQQLEQKQKTKVKLLEDAGGQKQFNFNLFTLAKNKQINFVYIIGNTAASTLGSNIFINRLINEFERNKLKKHILYKGIWSFKSKGDKLVKVYNKLGENRFLENLPSKVGTIIYGEYVAFLYTEDKSYAIEIKNGLLAQEFKTYFEHMWKLTRS